MKKVGLFFGTFNPIHNGHLKVANYFVEKVELEEVWLVVSPQNPFKKIESLIENNQRLRDYFIDYRHNNNSDKWI